MRERIMDMKPSTEFALLVRGEAMSDLDKRIEYLEEKKSQLAEEMESIEQDLYSLYQLKDSQDHRDTIESNRPGLY